MIRHSIIRQAVLAFAAYLFCVVTPLQASSQHYNRFLQQKTAPLLGKYLVSFKSAEGGTLRYILYIDSVMGVFFYGKLESDQGYHPHRYESCLIKGMLANSKHYDFVMKPLLGARDKYTLTCHPYEWLLNNKTYFSIKEPNIIRGYMVVQNDSEAPLFSFSGMKTRD